jgi:hypothetical protein
MDSQISVFQYLSIFVQASIIIMNQILYKYN